jgi:hypothetical protein
VATAQAEDGSDARPARVRDLSILGAYLVLPNPFSKSASILVKIRTETEFFQCRATVAHSAVGLGMGVTFVEISPPFLNVLQGWLLNALQHLTADTPTN